MLSFWLPLTILLQVVISPSLQNAVHQIPCNQLDTFTVELSPGENAVVHTTELLITHAANIDAASYANSKNVKLVLNDASIEFKGLIVPESGKPEEVIAWSNTGSFVALAILESYGSKLMALLKPLVVFPTKVSGSLNFPEAAEKEIIQNVRSCILRSLCKSAKSLNIRTIDFDPDIQQYESLSTVLVSAINEDVFCETQFTYDDIAQVSGNPLIDDAILEFKKTVSAENKTQISLPNMDQRFTMGSGFFSVNGRFRTENGYFKDLTTVERIGDATLTKAGERYSLQSSFTLRTAFMHYDKYTFSYGILPDFVGTVSGDIDGITLQVKVTIDYGSPTCIAEMEYGRVTDVGTLNINITGLSILNDLASELLSFLTTYWKGDAKIEIEKSLRSIVDDGLSEFECDAFKPILMAYFE